MRSAGDIRPSPRLGTLEVRVCDSASNVAEIGAITALIHCLVEYGSRILDRGEELPRTSPWFLAENKWRAARYGMDAVLIEDIHGNERHIDDLLDETVRELDPSLMIFSAKRSSTLSTRCAVSVWVISVRKRSPRPVAASRPWSLTCALRPQLDAHLPRK